MPLNKSKGNMYEWITHTWNPLGGKCPHGCSYCSTNKFYYPNLIEKYSGEPRLIEKELKTNLGSDNFIFVCAQNDLFAESIPMEFIWMVNEHCKKYNNKYLFQTKNPKRLYEFYYKHGLPKQSVICTTIETDKWIPKVMKNSPYPHVRAMSMAQLKEFDRYVTIEPVMKFNLYWMVSIIKSFNPIQVNIGADSGNSNLPEPNAKQIKELINELEKFTIVKQKNNLNRLLND